MTPEALAARAVEKIQRGGRHAATLLSTDEILAMAELCLLLAAKIRDLDPGAGTS
jgi:hypothetical protein